MSGFQPERGSEEWDRQHASIERGSEAWHQARGTVAIDRPWYARKRFIIPAGLGLLVLVGPWAAGSRHRSTGWDRSISSAGLDTAEQPLSFEECNRSIRSLADQLGITPSNIVDSNAMRIVRFSVADGSIVVTCDAADEKMIVVKSPAG